jgi:Flp pilus assembly protein TadG
MNQRASMGGRKIDVRASRGIATVEFAICAPLLFFLMLATAEFGRVLYQYNTLTKAVRDGARFAAINAAIDAGGTRVVNITPEIRNETSNLVVTGNIAGTGTVLLPGLSPANVAVENAGNGFVRVTATYNYVPILGPTLPTFGLGEPIDLTLSLPASVVMR